MSNRTRNLHAWSTRTEEGLKREVRAQLRGSNWTFTSFCKGDEDWTLHESPSLEDLEALEEVLFNKYQRKRLAWSNVLGVRKLIEAKKAGS